MAESDVLKTPLSVKNKAEVQIREAKDTDTAAIIAVLKASLGESKLKKSEEIWRYKHLDNPFGKSLVLLAVENDEVIGVRAFMRWKWQLDSKVYQAFRAVDTATHPDHQGKGIFKKLTLKAIELGASQGDHFIFNTPNDQSLPGYLKMGWKEVGKLPVRLIPVNPLRWSANRDSGYMILRSCDEADTERLCETHNRGSREKKKLFTPKSLNYLNWRYQENPLQNYDVRVGTGYYVAGYVKDHGRFREFRVVEHLYEDRAAFKELKEHVSSMAREHGVHFVSMGNMGKSMSLLRVAGQFGPMLTFRNITLNPEDASHYCVIDNWAYTLGDLELF